MSTALQQFRALLAGVDGDAGDRLRAAWERVREELDAAPACAAAALEPDPESDEASPAEGLEPAERTRWQIEQYIRAARDYGRLLVDASLDMIISVDLTLRIVEFNPAAEKCFGYTRAEILGRSVEELYRDPESAWKVRTASFSDGYVGQVWNRRKNGEVFPSRLTSRLVRNANGEVIGVMGISRDITDEVRTAAQLEARTRELEAARVRADAATNAKSLFLAHVSHEIRTPMTAILGYAECLRQSDLSLEDRAAAVEIICRNGEHLLSVVNDILDLSKIEAGKLTVERTNCAPVELVADVLELMRQRAAAKKLQLSVRWRGPIPAAIETDPTRLRQVLINLLGNAIKFTETGQVRVTVRLDARGAQPRLLFHVFDTGIGISPARAAALFEPFTQADATTSRCFGGTGLGLTICRRLAQALGGDAVLARSRPGRGSCFRATVATGPLSGVRHIRPPAVAPDRSTPRASASHEHELTGCSVLLAEDGPDNQRLISYWLRRAGARVTVVDNGRAAVDAVLIAAARPDSACDAHGFDVLLIDMQMPELDGYAAARAMRAGGVRTPIIALTAFVRSEDRDKCLAAGCDDFATKPIDCAALLRVVHAHYRSGQGVRQPTSAAASRFRAACTSHEVPVKETVS